MEAVKLPFDVLNKFLIYNLNFLQEFLYLICKTKTIKIMNKITETLSKFFNEKQIQAMKDAWRYGQWGDCEIAFPGTEGDSWALGACTNDIKSGGHFTGRQVSGILSGISKKITETQNGLVENIPDWWGDGSGDMIFFNYEKFGYENSSEAWDAFNQWSKSND